MQTLHLLLLLRLLLQPKESIPKATMMCIYVVILTSIGVVLVTCAIVGIDTLLEDNFALQHGYQTLLNTNSDLSFVLLPPLYLMSSAVNFAYSRYFI
jgi:hypothetical protein